MGNKTETTMLQEWGSLIWMRTMMMSMFGAIKKVTTNPPPTSMEAPIASSTGKVLLLGLFGRFHVRLGEGKVAEQRIAQPCQSTQVRTRGVTAQPASHPPGILTHGFRIEGLGFR